MTNDSEKKTPINRIDALESQSCEYFMNQSKASKWNEATLAGDLNGERVAWNKGGDGTPAWSTSTTGKGRTPSADDTMLQNVQNTETQIKESIDNINIEWQAKIDTLEREFKDKLQEVNNNNKQVMETIEEKLEKRLEKLLDSKIDIMSIVVSNTVTRQLTRSIKK